VAWAGKTPLSSEVFSTCAAPLLELLLLEPPLEELLEEEELELPLEELLEDEPLEEEEPLLDEEELPFEL